MVNKRVRGALGVAAMSFLVGACNEATPASTPEAKTPAAATRAAALESNSPTLVAKDNGGGAYFVRGDLGAFTVPAEGVSALRQADLAPALAAVAPLFKLDPSNLTLKKAYADAQGDVHARYSVRIQDTDVYGGTVILHARAGRVFAANANIRGDLPADARPAIDGNTALASAQSDRATPENAVVAENPRTAFWRDGDALKLVYVVEQTGTLADSTPVRDSLLIDAKSGDLLVRIPHIHNAKNREVHNLNHSTFLPGPLARVEGQGPVGEPVVDGNFDHLGTVYDCYSTLFGRDSIDNLGGKLISSVHYSTNYVNAFWDGTQMVYGDGDGVNASNLALSLDVTAHELTHAVTDYESELIYSGESGGLNESMSDIFGAICEWYHDGAVLPNRTWIVGDDVWTPSIPNDGLRYMDDPVKDGDSLDYYPNYGSGVDVHYSSGISNLAFYLLSQGGTHPRGRTTQVVAGVGIAKASQIWYKANRDLMTPSTTFEQAKTFTEQAAQQLGYDAATVESVSNAWKAVGVGVPVPPPPSTEIFKDQTVSGIGGARAEKVYFYVNVPEGASGLSFTTSGGTGDGDLYVRFNNPPTATAYDCRPFRSGNAENCTFAAPAEGKWWVMINGYSVWAGMSLVVTWNGGYIKISQQEGGDGYRIENLSGGENSSQIFTMDVPEYKVGSGKNTVRAVTGEGYGNVDLYVRRGSAPTQSSYDCRSVKEHATESCVLNNAPIGKYYFQVFGAKGGFTETVFGASFQRYW